MKKTTFILVIALSIFLIICFFAPAILYKKVPITEDDNIITAIDLRGKTDGPVKEYFLPKFNEINYFSVDNYFNIEEDSCSVSSQTLSLTIAETDDVETPMLEINSEWGDLIHAEVGDEGLTISVYDANADIPWQTPLIVPSGHTEIGLLKMPRGMLTKIVGGEMELNLVDFKDAELTINNFYQNLSFDNCSFKEFKLDK